MKIFLRPITEKDTSNIVLWRNSVKVRDHCMTKAPITADSHLKFYKENVQTGKYKQFIVERVDEEFSLASYPIATVYLKDMDYYNGRCELCIFTSNDVEWNVEGQSLAIKLLLDKAFNEYNMHKVYSYVFYKYTEDIELMKKAGFTVESILKEEALGMDGEYMDVIRMSVFNK
jgi:Acetyltransferases, including N-acetylases of ribosomal proteins